MRRGRIRLITGHAALALIAGFALAIPAASAGTCAPHDVVCEYQENLHTEPSGPLIVEPLPGAVQPQPVNVPLMEAFWAAVAQRRERGKIAVAAPGEPRLLLVPPTRAGWAGWCLIVRGIAGVAPRCPVDPSSGRQIGYEAWEGTSTFTRGYMLSGTALGEYAVDEGETSEPATPVPGFGSAVYGGVSVIPAPYPPTFADEFEPVTRGIRESGMRGVSAPAWAPADSYPAIGWHAPEATPDGACRIAATGLSRLRAVSGDVLQTLTPTPQIAGRGLLSCANTRFSFAGASLQAAVLLDAPQPGSVAPVALPGATRVARRRGLYSARGALGTILARRSGRAWLLVEGSSLARRERLLSHLTAAVLP
jgi:hypothetical protein